MLFNTLVITVLLNNTGGRQAGVVKNVKTVKVHVKT